MKNSFKHFLYTIYMIVFCSLGINLNAMVSVGKSNPQNVKSKEEIIETIKASADLVFYKFASDTSEGFKETEHDNNFKIIKDFCLKNPVFQWLEGK